MNWDNDFGPRIMGGGYIIHFLKDLEVGSICLCLYVFKG